MKTLDYIHKVEAYKGTPKPADPSIDTERLERVKGTPKPADPSIDTERLERVTIAELYRLNAKMPVTVKPLYEGA